MEIILSGLLVNLLTYLSKKLNLSKLEEKLKKYEQ